MRRYIFLAMFCVCGLAPAAYAEPAAQPAPFQPVGAPPDDPNQMICRTMGASSGSRIGGERECHTKKEWDMQRQEHQRALVSQQNHALMAAPR